MVLGFIRKMVFGPKTKERPIHEPRTVPIIIGISPEDLNLIMTCRRSELDDVLMDIIHNKNPTVYRVLKEYLCFNVMTPRSDASYKKRITSLVEAAEKSEVHSTDIKPEQKQLKGYSIFVDMRENRLCVSIWNGAAI